jgi:L-amino acid N-acyltransferase YncA
MGQICVGKNYRKMGYFSKLYHTLKTNTRGLPVITEIASINSRSLAAHKALGFEILGSHQEIDFNWKVVMWK